jgi:hypothetical protein
MNKSVCFLGTIAWLVCAAGASADITVKNSTFATIEVRTDNGHKQELKSNQTGILSTSRTESKVEVFVGIDKRATGIVKDRSKVKVVQSGANWFIVEDR